MKSFKYIDDKHSKPYTEKFQLQIEFSQHSPNPRELFQHSKERKTNITHEKNVSFVSPKS